MKKILNIGFLILSAVIMFEGIIQFDHANTGIELFRGLFWMLLGWFAFHSIGKESKDE